MYYNRHRAERYSILRDNIVELFPLDKLNDYPGTYYIANCKADKIQVRGLLYGAYDRLASLYKLLGIFFKSDADIYELGIFAKLLLLLRKQLDLF